MNKRDRKGHARNRHHVDLIVIKVEADELLGFLPGFSVPGRTFVREWRGGQASDGWIQLPFPEYEHDVEEFFDLVQKECWQDHAYDPARAGEMLADDGFIDVADILAIKTMLTYCARAERFADGAWGSFLEHGRIQRVLNRLGQIREGLP